VWSDLLGGVLSGVLGEVRRAVDEEFSGPKLMYLYK
jgi:hypothetical protein